MHSIQLKIHDSLYEQFLRFVGTFETDKIRIISDSAESNETRAYLANERDEINRGEARFVTQEEFEQRLSKCLAS